MCVERIDAGLLDPVSVLGITDLIVDEFQDLNYTDLRFVDACIRRNVNILVAGDDDQSIYSFRYAYPTGIQKLADNYLGTVPYSLDECFRCSPQILDTAFSLVKYYQSPGRVEKTAYSFCRDYTPRLEGIVHRWKFKSENLEYEAIANSCRALINSGIKPRDILILISNSKALLPGNPSVFQTKFDDVNVPLDMPKAERYINTAEGRLAYALIRIGCDEELQDYVAHRTVLGKLRGVGSKTYNGIRMKVIENDLNYLDLFYNPLPSDVFAKQELKAINRVREICGIIVEWAAQDPIARRADVIAEIIRENLDADKAKDWLDHISYLPGEMNLHELRAYLSTDNSEQQERISEEVYERLMLDVPEEGLLPQRVRVMTMHGAKGLNADIVFIPGLEEDIIPGEKRHKEGLIQEAARQIYVSITTTSRPLVSYATSRQKYGSRDYDRAYSQYCVHLNGPFVDRESGLTNSEANEIIVASKLYKQHLETRLKLV